MRVIVFGAGGCVGGWICEVLSQERDIELVACVRNWYSAVRLARRGVSLVQADLEDADAVQRLLTGADVVVNATMPPSAREPLLAKGLFDAAARAGVRRFIQFSSAAVYGNITGGVTEATPVAPNDDYSRGKASMEQLLLEAAVPSAPQLFILRPSIVYGPFADYWTVRYVQRITKGRWRGLGQAGEGICNLIHASDVARAVLAAAVSVVEPGPHVLNLNGPDVVTWNDYIEQLGDAMGTPDRVTPNAAVFRGTMLAAAAMRRAGQLTSLRSFYRRSTGTTRATMAGAQSVTLLYPAASELNLLGRRVQYSSDRAKRVLGVSPSIPLGVGLRQSVAWCRTHGVL